MKKILLEKELFILTLSGHVRRPVSVVDLTVSKNKLKNDNQKSSIINQK